MAYSDYKDKTTSIKYCVLELNLGDITSGSADYFSYSEGVWRFKISYFEESVSYGFEQGGFGYCPFMQGGTADLGTEGGKSWVGSLIVDGGNYTEKSSLALCQSNESSFYFDYGNQLLYVHFADNDDPAYHSISIGYTLYISDKAKADDDRYFEPRLISAPAISRSKDPAQFGLIAFDGGTATANNNDGYFDNIDDYDLYGQKAVLKHGFDDMAYADYLELFTGFIDGYSLDYDRLTVQITDDRARLDRKLPINTFDQTTYTNLNDKDVGKPIPIIYGEVLNVPIVCTNNEEGGSPAWTFKVCDVADHTNGIQAIDHVYVDGVEKTPSSTDLTNGTVTLANGDYDNEGDYGKVTADVQGVKDGSSTYIQNPLDVIEDLLSAYLAITYDSDNYNTTDWTAARSNDLANNVGIYIGKRKKIIDVIEGIAGSVNGNFLVEGDGKYSFKIYDSTDNIDRTIAKEEFLGSPEVKWSRDVFSSVRIGYARDWKEDECRWVVDEDQESTIFSQYRKYSDKDFETYLLNATDAASLGTAFMDYFDTVRPEFSITTKSQHFDLDPMDMVLVEIDRIGRTWFGTVRGEVLKINKDPLGNKCKITLKYAGEPVYLVTENGNNLTDESGNKYVCEYTY